MQLNGKALGFTVGLLGSGGLITVALLNLIWPGYGVAFLDVVDAVYPGYHRGTAVGLLVGSVYCFVDGFIGGWIFAWLYNRLSGSAATE
ncbi:MAG: hypothetical protein VYA69_05000 [Gemmatimonadota bacterium]|nr:hypothetical protein [Gemmatimonadota bacterium]